MSEFLSFAVGGLPYGCSFALAAVALVLSYRSTGVFNFAFGAQAYVAGVLYIELFQHGVPAAFAALLVVGVIGPSFGALLDWGLYSRIQGSNTTAKMISTLGVMVVLPNVLQIALGPTTVYSAPAPFLNNTVVNLGGVTISGPEIATVVTTLVVFGGLVFFLRTPRFGLPIRAVVESPRLLELSGVESRSVLRHSWMIATALSALAGVLYVPQYATQVQGNYEVLLVAGIAGAALGGLVSMPWAMVGGVALGLLQGIVPGYLTADTVWYQALVPSLPFFSLLILLLVHPRFRRFGVSSDPMASVAPPVPPAAFVAREPLPGWWKLVRWPVLAAVLGFAFYGVGPVWRSTFALGGAVAVIMLSITMLTGIAGQLSLAQASFAGIGAIATAQIAAQSSIPVIWAAFLGALIAGLGGWLASLPALRFRGLPVALLTFCLGLVADNLLFPTSWIGGGPLGISIVRPSFFGVDFNGLGSRPYLGMTVVVVGLVALGVHRLLTGTTGRGLAAVHASPIGAGSSGIPARRLTVIVFALSAVIAGAGGVLFAFSQDNVNATDFNSAFGPVFLVVVVTLGASSIPGAIQGGMLYAALPQLLSLLPQRVGGSTQGAAITMLVLSVGAFTYAKHPEGVVAYVGRVFRRRLQQVSA